jgi:hypothetical protein
MKGITSNICATAAVVIFSTHKIIYNIFAYKFMICLFQIKEVSRHAVSFLYTAVTTC